VKERKTMRRGFSLIELMFVVAIIVILAAVIIPNFTDITDRSKTARVSEDFSNFATALELYRGDWGTFPIAKTAVAVNDENEVFFKELTGTGTTNTASSKTITGFEGGIPYVKPATLENLVSPYNPSDTYYYKTDDKGRAWVLYAEYVKKGKNMYVWRSDSTSALQFTATKPEPKSESEH